MFDSSNAIKEKIFTGKQALANDYIDLANQAFQEALNASIPEGPSQNSLIGIAQVYLLLAQGTKGTQEDKSTATQITEALSLLPPETNKLESYIFLLIDIGEGFQKISFFESSSVIYQKTLQYAQTQGAKQNIRTISKISKNLAFSYQKIGKIESAAKLYRIAADLEEEPEEALTYYRSSAYQYYQAGMKDEALNIFQTAFDKAGILQQTELQNEIAGFQGIISYEIFKAKDPIDLSSPDLEYLNLAYEKFSYLNDLDWLARIEKERVLLSSQTKNEIPEAIESEKQPSIEIPISSSITFEKKSSEMNEFLDESTRTLNSFAKLSSERIESKEEIEELHLADKLLSDDKTVIGSGTINSYVR